MFNRVLRKFARQLRLQIIRLPKSFLSVPRDVEWLKDFPRFTPTQIPLFGKAFRLADALSFYYSYREIFLNDIYRFRTENPEPYIIDCGANCGLSVLYFKKVYPRAKILAFEPDPHLFKILKANTTVFGLQDVELVERAVWHNESCLHFLPTKADGGHLTCIPVQDSFEVNTVPLSRYLARQVDLLKVDVEGSEVDILTQTPNLERVLRLFVEYHSYREQPQRLHELLQVIEANGFRYHIHTQFSSKIPFVLVESQSGMDLQLNIFASREECLFYA